MGLKCMSAVILHIGLPKTGTTVLQNRFFAREHCYAGKSIEGGAKQFAYTVQTSLLDHSVEFVASLIEAETNKRPGRKLIMSNEAFSQISYNKRRTFVSKNMDPVTLQDVERWAIIPVIEALSRRISTKIIVSLRSQPEWMASNYAQLSNSILKPSQNDFETRVRKHLSSNSNALNWSKIVQSVINLAGRENVLVLLLEEMNQESYFRSLAEFMNISIEHRHLLGKEDVLNRRRASECSWKMRDFEFSEMNFVAKQAMRSIGLPKAPGIFRKPCRRLGKSAAPMLNAYFNNERHKEIVLTKALKNEILLHCKPFNETLAGQLGRNLHRLGYFPEVP